MDEKGFLIGVLQKVQRIFTKEAFEKGKLLGAGQDGNREWITVLATICMDGTFLPPGLIYQALSGNIQDTWLDDFNPEKQSASFSSSPSGWTNDVLGLSWLQTVFDTHTRQKARNGRDWRLLLVDGHGSHLNMPFLDWCELHKIHVALYPSHSTHRLQPLDVGLFRPLANFYSQELNTWIHTTQGLCRISKREFFSIFWPAFQRAFTPQNILSSWEKTGLQPFNPEKVLHQITISRTDTRPSTSDSITSSALSNTDWRTIRRLLKGVVGDGLGPDVRSLANTLEKLTTENSILTHENEGLRKAVFIEKSRRKRGKPLFHLLREDNEVKAMFFSPSKIQAARDSQTHKQQEKQRLEAEKQHEKLQRLLEKENKAKAVQQRKCDREEARARKQQEMKERKAIREQAKEDRQVQQQLQRELKEQKNKAKNNRKALISVEPVVTTPLPTTEGVGGVSDGVRPRRTKRTPHHLHGYDL
ncbi:MAG: hypothetical protein ACJ8LM_17345 [Candidatus Udaeobacter sp.]